jgi:MFS family permease
VPDRVLRAIDRPVMDHRGAEFASIVKESLEGMRKIVQTRGPVVMYPASGSGAWEEAIVNTLSPGDRVLMFETGHFSRLWRQVAERFGIHIDYLPGTWRTGVVIADIEAYFLHSYGLKLQNSALFSAGVFFAGVVGNTLGGVVSDHILTRTGSRNKARGNLVMFGFLCSLACMLPLLFAQNLTWAAICLSLAFFFSEFTVGPLWAIPMDIAPRFAGSASGLMNTGTAFAAIISPLVFGFVIDKTGNWDLPFIGSIGLLLLGAILAFWMKPEESLSEAELLDYAPKRAVV